MAELITLPAAASAAPRHCLFPIEGDYMEPRLTGWLDYVLVVPATRFLIDGLYLMDLGDGVEGVRVVSRTADGYRVSFANPKYTSHVLTREEFQREVRGFVAGELKMQITAGQVDAYLNGRRAA